MNTIKVGTISTISEGPFFGSVYAPAKYETGERWGDDYTGENRAAHGWICITEEESNEGRRRSVNLNGHHREVGPWGPTKAQRDAEARAEARAQAYKKRDAEASHEDAAATALGVRVVSCDGINVVCEVRGEQKVVPLSAIVDAARDPWHPRMTRDQAIDAESRDERETRLAYRSLLRSANR